MRIIYQGLRQNLLVRLISRLFRKLKDRANLPVVEGVGNKRPNTTHFEDVGQLGRFVRGVNIYQDKTSLCRGKLSLSQGFYVISHVRAYSEKPSSIHSSWFGDQMPMHSPGFRPAARKPAAIWFVLTSKSSKLARLFVLLSGSYCVCDQGWKWRMRQPVRDIIWRKCARECTRCAKVRETGAFILGCAAQCAIVFEKDKLKI